MIEPEIISVSQYLDKLNTTLKGQRSKVVGELTGLQMYEGRSYLYFSIKDSKDQSTVKCFMWKRDFQIAGVNLKDGLEIIVTAYPNIYKPNGGLTMQVEMVELVGEGALQIAYDNLKKKLELEGLFSVAKKRAIPEYPHRIGVITSKSGAVINDFLTNIGKFGYEIIFVDSKVEGQDSIKDLLSAITTLKKKDIDVLVIMRGGGSLESFMAFNNETLVRAVADFPVPVLTGIGHDKDVPLVSLVSDKNVSTPTAVANLLNESWDGALSLVNMGEEKIFSKFTSLLRDKMFFIENSVIRMERGIKVVGDNIKQINESIVRGFSDLVQNTSDFLNQSEKTLSLLNPTRQLSQGYSIIKHNGKVVKSRKNVKTGDKLELLVSDGIINSQIT
ncbi:MAG: exodeoxyribonuclease VII large subunit [Parcubacteria group bacterium]